MKRILSLTLPLVLVFGLSLSCRKESATAQPTPVTTTRWVNTAHLDHLYQLVKLTNGTEVGTVAIYSEAPDYRLVGDSDEGFTCVDDVARAALFWLHEPDLATNTIKQTQLRKTIEFVLQQQSPNGYFYNFLFPNLLVNTAGPTSINQANFWSWRALWCLSEAYPYYLNADPTLAVRLQTSIKQTVSNMVRDFGAKPLSYTFIKGLKIPQWLPYGSGTDQAAIMLLGLLNTYQQTPDPAVLSLMNQLAAGILAMQPGDPATASSTFPYGVFLSFENTWHAYAGDQAYALLRAGKVLNKPDWVTAARREVDNFYPYLLKEGFLNSFVVEQVGTTINQPSKTIFAQIAYGVRPFAWAAMEAYDQTQDTRYATIAAQLLSWFLGNNQAKTVMYDATTGRGYDGISSAAQINHNAGAESTIEALWAFQKLDNYPAVGQQLEKYR